MDAKNTAAKQTKEKVENQININSEKAEDQITNLVSNAENKFEGIKNKVSDNLSNIADKVHGQVDSSHNYLDHKIDDVGSYAHQTFEKANKLGHRAADAISGSSEYIKNLDVEKTKENIKEVFKEKPEITIAAVALLGLLVGYLVGRKTA